MKTITYMKTVEIETTIEHPIITFVAEKVRIMDDGYSYDKLAYTARFNGLKQYEYRKSVGMSDRDLCKMLEKYVMETFNLRHGTGSIHWYCYSGKELGLPDLPKLENDNFNDDHADLVNMFKGL